MNEVLLTQEVGSLAKPDWRVAAIAGQELTREHVRDAARWADKLGLDPIAAEDVLCTARHHQRDEGAITSEDIHAIKDLAALDAVTLQEDAGIDIVYDGEQDRSEMYEHSVRRTRGFESRGRIRVFDNRTFHKFALVDEPGLDQPWHRDEIERLKRLTNHEIKVPITGPYTIADWSFDEHFGGDRVEFVESLSEQVVRPNILSILGQGVEWVQIDEPAAGTKASEIDLFVHGFNIATAQLAGKFSIHLCYSKWEDFIPHIGQLEHCHQLSIEFANRDSQELGRSSEDRPAYEVLKDIHRELPETGIGLGVVSIHEDRIESPELVRDRVLRAVELVGDPALIYPSPDCGLRTRSLEVAYQKLRALVLTKLELVIKV
jgi:5-methyltetrahydropteroyltriglutamate--homocysteine methyltransferase